MGGGSNNSGTLFITRSTIVGSTGSSLEGGGLGNVRGTVTILQSTIAGNQTIEGGGLNNFQGTVTILQSTIARNESLHAGGGISNVEGALTIVNSAIVNNTAGDGVGGGISNTAGGVIIRNSTLARNISGSTLCGGGDGGAIFNATGFAPTSPLGPGTVSLTNSTIADNAAVNNNPACGPGGVGGGISTKSGATVMIQNTLLAHNTAGGAG